jgi:hypothetical protein
MTTQKPSVALQIARNDFRREIGLRYDRLPGWFTDPARFDAEFAAWYAVQPKTRMEAIENRLRVLYGNLHDLKDLVLRYLANQQRDAEAGDERNARNMGDMAARYYREFKECMAEIAALNAEVTAIEETPPAVDLHDDDMIEVMERRRQVAAE